MNIVAVGLGEPKHARHFGGKLAPSVTCITNEEPIVYEAFGIEKGNMLRLLAPDAMAAGARAARQGHRQGQATGDQQRLPGTFIIDAQGIVRYAYYGKFAGDQPDLEELVRWWRTSSGS